MSNVLSEGNLYVGAASLILCGSMLEIGGFHLNSIQAIPGGPWEVFTGVWLIAKSFNTSAAPLEGATFATHRSPAVTSSTA